MVGLCVWMWKLKELSVQVVLGLGKQKTARKLIVGLKREKRPMMKDEADPNIKEEK